ncbi:hypothetical protein GALL_111650 [mine drainage metagenome]|uniref:Uncharacterized protein n=1 Tax=mine drainage metagenome TaxID=410659 RepID=A0A1J5SR98_9ZZZZ
MRCRSYLIIGALFVLLCLVAPSRAAEPHQSNMQQGGSHEGMVGGERKRGMRESIMWTRFPRLKVMMGGEGGERKQVKLMPKNIAPSKVDAYSNDVNAASMSRQLPYDLISATLDKPATGGFHWISAREVQADKELVASTVYYMSEHGSKDPTAMFMLQKNALEIIPQPFPREHSRYRANEDWHFLVRFNSKPLAQQKVMLETQNGSKAEFMSDVKGIVTVHFPSDFKSADTQVGMTARSGDRRQSSEFVLATELVEAGKTYLIGFNSNYGPDAFSNRSLALGLGFTFLGMLGATPLLRNRKADKKGAVKVAPTISAETNQKDA